MSTADDRREEARGNGVGQAGQFGHQHHSAPAAFDADTETTPLAEVPTPTVWVGFTHYNARGSVSGYSDDERVDPDAVRQVLDSWPIASVKELNSDDPQEASELLAGALAAGGKVPWKLGERTSASATPDSYELNQYLAARQAREAQLGQGQADRERREAIAARAHQDLIKATGEHQRRVASIAALVARQLHPDAKEVLVGVDDGIGEYTLVGVRNRDGSIDTEEVNGDDGLRWCLEQMPWENPEALQYIDEGDDDVRLRDEYGAGYLLDIDQVALDTLPNN